MARKSSARRSDGRFEVKVYIGTGDDGKKKYRAFYGKTQKEAREAADEFRARIRKGMDTACDSDTFAVWRDRWFSSKRRGLGASQIGNYQSYMNHLDPISDLKIRDVRPYHVQQIIDDLADRNPKTHKPTAKKTLLDVRNTARQIFQCAVDNRVLDWNPADPVTIPDNAPQEKRRALTEAEKELIFTTPHKMQTAAMIQMLAGLRRSEIIALCWSDIDLRAGTISVNKAADLKNKGRPIKLPKTDAGYRTVFIPAALVDYLSGLKRDNILVFPTVRGKMYTASSWKAGWRSYMIELDMASGKHPQKRSKFDPHNSGIVIDQITSHMLRHTACTMMFEAGMDLPTVQAQIGHADSRMTLEVYTHISKQHRDSQTDRYDDYLSRYSSNVRQTEPQTVDL